MVRSWVLAVVACGACDFSARPATPGAPDDALQLDGDLDGAQVTIDAMPDAAIAGATCVPVLCTAAGGTCNVTTDRCMITEQTPKQVTCPTGHACTIVCASSGSCNGGVDCTSAAVCEVTCSGSGSCRDNVVSCPLGGGGCAVRCHNSDACMNQGVTCGGGPCNVSCVGSNACKAGVRCGSAASCTAECEGSNACENGGIACGSGPCAAECDGSNACASTTCSAIPASCSYNCCAGACQNFSCNGCIKGMTCD